MLNQLDLIEDALEDIRLGKVVIVVDDEDRENEGDFVAAAEMVTPEMINFMATHGRGLICAPILEKRAEELDLQMMVGKNTDPHQTQFTVSVDLIGQGCTTGISAKDRSKTIKALTDPNTKAEDLGRPGHIFPLKARNGGVLRRTGHTEATVDLARLAGLEPAGVIVEIMNEDGTMARLPQLLEIAKKHDLKIISIEDLVAYRMEKESLIEKMESVKLPTEHGDFTLTAYKQINTGRYHVALHKGEWSKNDPVLVRVHSSCVTGDIFGSCRCDCGLQLEKAMQMVEEDGNGVIVYMNQEGRGIGFLNKLKAYKLQEEGYDTVQANEKLGFKPDERDYGVGAQILRDLGVSKLRLMTNNPKKQEDLSALGVPHIEQVKHVCGVDDHNLQYLKAKRDWGHKLGEDDLSTED